MTIVGIPIEDAQHRLATLWQAVADGKHVVFTRGEKVIADFIPKTDPSCDARNSLEALRQLDA